MSVDSILFVGDIQGCKAPLEALLKAAGYNPDNRRLIPVGDTLNRGPDNVSVLSLLKKLGAEPIRGNHEEGLLKRVDPPPNVSLSHKPDHTWQDILTHPERDRFIDWIRSWPYLRRGPGWLAVHGGLHPTKAPEKTPPRFLVSVRVCNEKGEKPKGWDGFDESIPEGYLPWHHFYKGEDTVIFGHWARRGLQIGPNYRGLDSGAVYGLPLTGLLWPEDKIIQVPGLRLNTP